LRSTVFSFLLLLSFLFPSEWKFFEEVSFSRLVKELLNYQVIYVGEVHDSEEIHEIQLKVLKSLHQRYKKVILAMEMFQQPYQEFLDKFVEGEIDEEEMLKGTKYKRTWGMKKELYQKLWNYAQKWGIRIIALNVPFKLLKEVREKGIEKVRSVYLPPRIVYPPKEYKEFLLGELKRHKKGDEKSFLGVQTAWDNAMAYKILKTLLLYPDYKVIVIIGKGHLYKGYGVPYVLKKLYPNVKQAVLFPEEEYKFYFLFSMDFSKEYSSTNSIKLPN